VPQKYITKTTFICVVRSVPTTLDTEELKKSLFHSKILITNAVRIRNDRGPLPITRPFTRDPNTVSFQIINGLTIGGKDTDLKNDGLLLECGQSHISYSCKLVPKINLCASCKREVHRTVAANCPLCPFQSISSTPTKKFRCEELLI